MAEVTTQLLRSKGYDVERRSGYDTTSLRKAQEAGLVDIYWEYTGTWLRELNKSDERLNPADAYERVKRLDASRGLIWLKPSQVNNSYALAMRRTEAAKRGIATISDLARRVNSGERFVFASNYEFYERADGLRPLERAYGFEFGRDQVVRLDSHVIYQVLHDLRNIDVGLVFATDGRVAAYDLLLLIDDRGFFPDYAMAPVLRRQTLERHPELAAHLDLLSGLLWKPWRQGCAAKRVWLSRSCRLISRSGATKAFVLFLSQGLSFELAPKGVYGQAVLPAATRTEVWERAGADINALPALMEVGELVDAALVGFDRREAVTLPPLHDARQWDAYQSARQAMLPGFAEVRAAEALSHSA